MTTAAQDAELLARVLGGDHDAFNVIMRNHEDRVFSVCLRIMGNREHALDATQETFLTAFRKAEQLGLKTPPVYVAIAKMAVRTGDVASAKQALQRSLAVDPSHAESRELLTILEQGG